jgi:hypothetical protein
MEYWSVPMVWLATVGTVAFGCGAVGRLLLRQESRLWTVPLLAALAVFAAGEYGLDHTYFLQPPPLGPPKIDAEGVVWQSSGVTCAAAACANLARFYGIEKSEKDMVDLLGTTADGTTASQVVYGMRRLGFRCVKRRIGDADISRLDTPAVLFITFGDMPLGHAVAYVGLREGLAEIRDPAGGTRFVSPEDLRQSWLGHAVVVTLDKRG